MLHYCRGTTLAPFCNRLIDFQSPARLGCTTDREIVSVCNLLDYGGTPIPTEYQACIYKKYKSSILTWAKICTKHFVCDSTVQKTTSLM